MSATEHLERFPPERVQRPVSDRSGDLRGSVQRRRPRAVTGRSSDGGNRRCWPIAPFACATVIVLINSLWWPCRSRYDPPGRSVPTRSLAGNSHPGACPWRQSAYGRPRPAAGGRPVMGVPTAIDAPPTAWAPSFGGEWAPRAAENRSIGFAEADDCRDDTAAPTVDRPQTRTKPRNRYLSRAELKVRIHSPPADSPSLSGFRLGSWKSPGFAPVWRRGQAVRSAETRKVQRHRAEEPVVSLSGDISVPRRRRCGSHRWGRRRQAR